MSDKRYLEWHGKQWRVQVRVPPSLHEAIGKKRLVHPLHTSSLANANRIKWDVVAKLKAVIRAADKDTLNKSDTQTDEALRWRHDIETDRAEEIAQERGREADGASY
jgi:hypothetical protein